MTRRDKLIKDCQWNFGYEMGEEIADFILNREKRILKEIRKPLKESEEYCQMCDDKDSRRKDMAEAQHKALSIIDQRIKEERP